MQPLEIALFVAVVALAAGLDRQHRLAVAARAAGGGRDVSPGERWRVAPRGIIQPGPRAWCARRATGSSKPGCSFAPTMPVTWCPPAIRRLRTPAPA